MGLQYSTTVRNAKLDAIEPAIGTAAVLKIRTGAKPANVAAADSGTVLATLSLPSDWMAAASGGSVSKSGTWEDLSADNDGTAAAAGKYIRGVSTITLSATTGTAGNFGITATRFRCALYKPIANSRFTADWAGLGLPELPNSACLFPIQLTTTTSTGAVRATGKIVHG